MCRMGIIDKIFKKRRARQVGGMGFAGTVESNPTFSAYSGAIYEQELTRAAIERFAVACSKLKPELMGNASPSVRKLVASRPNDMMTWPTFLARLATLYEVEDTAFVVPSFKPDMQTVDGIWPLKCEFAEVLDYRGEPWIRFNFATGETSAIEMRYVVILAKFQYSSDFFGEPNCIGPTMRLIDAQNKAQEAAINNGAKIRFIGSMASMMHEEDIEEKRESFVKRNLTANNSGGIILYDNTFHDVKQLEPYSYTIDAAEMERIERNVCNYFGTNADILQNSYSEDTWGAWYEGRVEPFGLKLGEGLTNMLFSPVQVSHGNRVTFSSNRLEYASNASKRNMVRDMVDRGLMSINEGREVLQMAPVEGGDARVIRGEYLNSSAIEAMSAQVGGGGSMPMNEGESDTDPGGDDDIYRDSDAYGKDDF